MKRHVLTRRINLRAAALISALGAVSPLWAADFGMLAQGDVSFIGKDFQNGAFAWNGSLTPWVSVMLGERGDGYVSARLTVAGNAADETARQDVALVPELLHAELEFRFTPDTALRAGRMNYRAPLECIAGGLFDGLRFSRRVGGGEVSVGAWYTGLLYKRSANILMLPADTAAYNRPLDYTAFNDTYFASKRVLTALEYEHPALGGVLQARAAFIGQVDINPLDAVYRYRLHSQYLTGTAAASLGERFTLEGGAAFEMVETEGGAEGAPPERRFAAAAEARVSVRLARLFPDRLSALGRFSTGGEHGFIPVTGRGQGNVLRGSLREGLSLLEVEYTARLTQTFSVELSAWCFFQDPQTPYDSPLAAPRAAVKDGPFLGSEFDGRIVWSPFSDLSMQVNGGVFIPREGAPSVQAAVSATMAVY